MEPVALPQLSRPPRTLEARGLVLRRGGRAILDGASLLLKPGEAVAIQGPSGSGKSTLVRTLATLLEADEGTVLLGGQDARTLVPAEYRRVVAFLSQQPAMFPGSVESNLAAGPELRGATLSASMTAALLGTVRLPAQLAAREAKTLSGGEQQRVALARALANDPEILLLDEPTASLDPAAGEQIVALLSALAAAGRSVLMVTHLEAHARALGGTRYRCDSGRLSPEAA